MNHRKKLQNLAANCKQTVSKPKASLSKLKANQKLAVKAGKYFGSKLLVCLFLPLHYISKPNAK